MYCISRFIEGISLNGKEYILTDNGNMQLFYTIEEALQFLIDNGIDQDTVNIEAFIAD